MSNNYNINIHKDKIKQIESILDNHGKLLSMLSPRVLPIKQSLLKDVTDVKKILEVAYNKNKKEGN